MVFVPGNPNAFPPQQNFRQLPGNVFSPGMVPDAFSWLWQYGPKNAFGGVWPNPLTSPPPAIAPGLNFSPYQQTPIGPAPRGLLDQRRDVSPNLADFPKDRGLLGQDIAAKIIPFGLNPYSEMRDPGAGGGRGLLGSQWRNPEFIQQYEVQQGLKPGSLQPVQRPSATVRDIPSMPKQPDLTRSLYDKVTAKYAPGGQWEYTDARGVKMQGVLEDILGKHSQGTDMTLAFRNSKGGLDMVSGSRLKEAKQIEPSGPTPAQMARPVQATPEIQAKLADARAVRAQRGLMGETFRNMNRGLWGNMSAADRSAWLRDAKWKSWPVEDQRTFMERFMPKGIGGP